MSELPNKPQASLLRAAHKGKPVCKAGSDSAGKKQQQLFILFTVFLKIFELLSAYNC